jgi:hypothetical protein
METYRIEYQRKLAAALDKNDSSKNDLEKNGDLMQTSDEDDYPDQNSKDTDNLQKLISGQNDPYTQFNLEENISNFNK